MHIERIDLNKIRQEKYITSLESLEVGDSIFCEEFNQAQSMRVLSYYLIRSRSLNWGFTMRKMDRGWRLIRIK